MYFTVLSLKYRKCSQALLSLPFFLNFKFFEDRESGVTFYIPYNGRVWLPTLGWCLMVLLMETSANQSLAGDKNMIIGDKTKFTKS